MHHRLWVLVLGTVSSFTSAAAWAACGDGTLEAGEACDDGGTVSGDGCTAACRAEACGNNLGLASNFNVFSLDDYIGGVDIAGRVAARDLVDLRGFRVGYDLGAGATAIIAGNLLQLNYGTVYGDALYGHTIQSDDRFAVSFVGGGPVQADPIDFDAAEAAIFGTSTFLASLPPNGATLGDAWGNVGFDGADPVLNVFEIDAATLASATWLGVRAPAGSTVVINVLGDPAAMRGFDIRLFGVDPQQVLYHFPDAVFLELYGIDVRGSVLAPNAFVWFDNGQMHGTLIADSVEGPGEFYRDGRFRGGWACP